MNYRERIVYYDLKGMGYDISFSEEKGYPDFKVFSFKTKEAFYVEVKSSITKLFSQIQYTKNQEVIFKKLIKEGNNILIALPEKGELTYTFFDNQKVWRKTYYGESEIRQDMEQVKCKRCGHEWLPRTPSKPQMCPRCKSYKWETKK